MGIRDKPIAPGSPWQNGYAERLIGTIRRECLDHVIVFGEAHLRRILGKYLTYYKGREFIARSTRMPHFLARLSTSASSHHDLSLAGFITNIAESDFRYTQGSRHLFNGLNSYSETRV
jgi:transposase InsO family protein